MKPRSVRLRVTVLVTVLTAIAAGAAAVYGAAAVRDALVDDAIDAQVEEAAFLIELSGITDEGDFFALSEAAEAAFALDALGTGPAADELWEALEIESGDQVPVLLSQGAVALLDPSDGDFGSAELLAADDIDEPVVSVFTLFELGSEEPFVDEPSFGTGELEFVRTDVSGTALVLAVDLGDANSTGDNIRTGLLIATAVLAMLAGFAAWFLTGRALRPVGQISAQAAAITSGTLHSRVPVPNTGDEVAELATTVNGMLDRLELSDRRRRQFISDASHELRSPVAVLKSEAEVALRRPDDTSVPDLAESVLAESERMGGVVEDLLSLARSDEAAATAARRPVDLDDVVLAEADRSRRVPVDRRGVSAGRVLARVDEMTRLTGHLLDNAARHARSQVAVGVERDGDRVVLYVDDDGDGIPATDRDRVFDRFARLEEARTLADRGGAGLGLAVVATTAADLGGRAWVEDSPLGGARVIVQLPAAPLADGLRDLGGLGRLLRYEVAYVWPPSILMTAPVVKLLASLAR